MKEYYTIDVAGLKRDLPLCELTDDLQIGAFVIFGDVELTVHSAEMLLKKAPEDIMIYTYVQEELRMNASAEELIDTLVDCGCKISSQKQIEEAMKNLWKLGNNLRKWDYRGHTYVEIQKNEKIIAFPGTKKVYPNDPCPCGSGKKYKNCCGKK